MKNIEVTHTGGASWKQIREVVRASSFVGAIAKVQESGNVRDDDIVSVKVVTEKGEDTIGLMQA